MGAGRCGLERLKEGEPGIAEGRRGVRIPATSPVISGPLRSREGRGEEGADARGRLVSGCDAGLLGARGADRWGRRLRRVARGASPDVERASRAERGAERWAERDAARGGAGLVQRSWAEAGAAWEQAGARELGPCGSRKGLG